MLRLLLVDVGDQTLSDFFTLHWMGRVFSSQRRHQHPWRAGVCLVPPSPIMCVCVLLKCMELCTHSAELELFRPASDSSNTHMPTAAAIKDSSRLCQIVENGVQHVGHGIKDPAMRFLTSKTRCRLSSHLPSLLELASYGKDHGMLYSAGNQSKEKFDFAALK